MSAVMLLGVIVVPGINDFDDRTNPATMGLAVSFSTARLAELIAGSTYQWVADVAKKKPIKD